MALNVKQRVKRDKRANKTKVTPGMVEQQ